MRFLSLVRIRKLVFRPALELSLLQIQRISNKNGKQTDIFDKVFPTIQPHRNHASIEQALSVSYCGQNGK